jgi:hypothetical protein
LKDEGVPTFRPDDFFAEMFKNQKTMSAIKGRLVAQRV